MSQVKSLPKDFISYRHFEGGLEEFTVVYPTHFSTEKHPSNLICSSSLGPAGLASVSPSGGAMAMPNVSIRSHAENGGLPEDMKPSSSFTNDSDMECAV